MVSTIQKHLFSLQDEKYKEFNGTLCNTCNKPMIGVRVPLLRQYAKELLKDNKEIVFKDEYYEEIMLHGFYIAGYKCDYETKVKMVDSFIPLIDNWAVCDSFSSSLKFIKKNQDDYLKYIKKYLKSNKEYYQRFGFVALLDYYKEEKYSDDILDIIKNEKYNGYYSLMASAWLLSYCFIAYFDKTLDYVKSNKINDFVYKKGIQKALESFRISDKQKKILKSLN